VKFCLQDGGVSESFTHKTTAWEFCLQYGGVSEDFAHKMAAWEFCLQDGGVSESFKYILRLQRVRRSPCAPLKLFFAPPPACWTLAPAV